MIAKLRHLTWYTTATFFGVISWVYADGDGSVDGDDETVELINPLQSSTIQEFLGKVVEVLVILATPIIVLFIMYAGFLFTTARGNEAQLAKAKSALLWAVVGGVIVVGASLIADVLQGTIEAL